MKYQGKITDPKDLVTKEYVDTGLSGKLGTSGDGSNVTAAFTAASSRTNISTGEKLSVIFGKTAKWFADLGAAAFRGVDATPTANSTNLVESGAIKSALDNKADIAVLAQPETSPTTHSYQAGDLMTYDGKVYEAIATIAIGATLVPGDGTSGNVQERTIAQGLTDVVVATFTKDTSKLSDASISLYQVGRIWLFSGAINFNGNVAGNNATLGTFNLKPGGDRTFMGWATYNGTTSFRVFKITSDGSLKTATGSGTFSGQAIFPSLAFIK